MVKSQPVVETSYAFRDGHDDMYLSCHGALKFHGIASPQINILIFLPWGWGTLLASPGDSSGRTEGVW